MNSKGGEGRREGGGGWREGRGEGWTVKEEKEEDREEEDEEKEEEKDEQTVSKLVFYAQPLRLYQGDRMNRRNKTEKGVDGEGEDGEKK